MRRRNRILVRCRLNPGPSGADVRFVKRKGKIQVQVAHAGRWHDAGTPWTATPSPAEVRKSVQEFWDRRYSR